MALSEIKEEMDARLSYQQIEWLILEEMGVLVVCTA
jgi:hypothetical protein